MSWPQGRGAGCPRLLLGRGSAQVSVSPRLPQKGSKRVRLLTPGMRYERVCEQVDVCSLCVTKRIPVRTRIGTHMGCERVGMCHLVCSHVSHEAVTPRV